MSLVNNVRQVESVSAGVAYLILRISKWYSLKVIQVYAPTLTHSNNEVEAMYEDVNSYTCFKDLLYGGDKAFQCKTGHESGRTEPPMPLAC